MRILYLGMFGELSLRPLAALIKAGATLCAVVVPASDPKGFETLRELEPPQPDADALPVLSKFVSPNIVTLAWDNHIPVFEVADIRRSPSSLDELRPDLICVSCFSRIIPRQLLALPKFGALNLHPSLLPAYRGPSPLFWQFRNGETRAGVTLHFMNERADAGDILLQSEVKFPDGITSAEAERICAAAGAQLMVDGIKLVENGNPPHREQSEGEASYFPFPSRADCTLSTEWPARRAFNFMRGASEWSPFEIRVSESVFRVREALAYSPDEKLGESYRREGNELLIQFSPGVLRVSGACSF